MNQHTMVYIRTKTTNTIANKNTPNKKLNIKGR